MNLPQAETAIAAIEKEKIPAYKEYWESIAPKNDEEYFWRWIFSFLSVHTTWSANVKGYKSLREKKDVWKHNKEELSKVIVESGVGLHKRRTEGIWSFTQYYFQDPLDWKKKEDETWVECRNRLQKRCLGIGLAKTAFALEMCYPNENESVCLDTHMLQLYGFTSDDDKRKAMKYKLYSEMEQHWADLCKAIGVSACIGRALFWDKKQKQEDSRYWSYVFE
jgi:thermostable 8-oxoguanine DNA glycosylase